MTISRPESRGINRALWIVLFVAVSAWLGWLEWRSGSGTAVGWFFVTSLWSAVCGVGYTLCDWWLARGRRG